MTRRNGFAVPISAQITTAKSIGKTIATRYAERIPSSSRCGSASDLTGISELLIMDPDPPSGVSSRRRDGTSPAKRNPTGVNLGGTLSVRPRVAVSDSDQFGPILAEEVVTDHPRAVADLRPLIARMVGVQQPLLTGSGG